MTARPSLQIPFRVVSRSSSDEHRVRALCSPASVPLVFLACIVRTILVAAFTSRVTLTIPQDLFSPEVGGLSVTHDRVKWLSSMDQESRSELFERRGFDRLTLHKIM